MQFDPILLIVSVLLLWPPGYLFFSGTMHSRIQDAQGSNGLRLGRIFSTWQNWFDGVRGYLGAHLLYAHTFPLERDLGDAYYYELGALGVVLVMAVLVQVLYYRHHLYAVAPLFFLVGVASAVFAWWIVLHGVIAGLVLGRLANTSEAFLMITAVVVGAFGYLVYGIRIELLLVSALLVLPVAIAFAAQESLLAPHR